MTNDKYPAPRHYKGVTISSTFTDLKEHRAALIKAIKGQGLTDVAMENDSAKPNLDVIDSSLQMVRDGSAYIGVISSKYGQIPKCPNRNAGNVSITELEFNEAQRLDRPILLFVMGEKHPLVKADVETNATKARKLKGFQERAKKMKPDSAVHRVYATFDGLEEFKEKAIHAVSDLRRYLDEQVASANQESHEPYRTKRDPIPSPPAFYAEPPYIGSHEFVGRKAQLETLSDWASAAEPHPILLFEAIGGAGKSMLTWEWTTKHATNVRRDWAGRFWYSFYEKGAIMADFCRRALAYVTGQPLEDFRKRKTAELGEMLLHQLQAHPWLLVLDGLERVLVAYHRFDAAQLADEEAGTTDEILHRDPCAGIRPEDEDLLRALTAASPSKLLLTTRLTPRVLLNQSSQPIPDVLRVHLPGLRPADAEALLRSCAVTGNSEDIQNYVKSHCDCHPLVTGVLGGLINNYLPDRGNFDAWAIDAKHGGGQLNLANLDLVQKRNHILHAALEALPKKSRQLLSTLALLSEAIDYMTLCALNPHLPPKPEMVEEPRNPETGWRWEGMSDDERHQARQDYQTDLQRRKGYEQAVKARLQSPEFLAAPGDLGKTVHDLERRGLLQYEVQARRYDLHPVVRGIAAGGLAQEEREYYGQRVVDHFSQQAHRPYEEAETLDDLRDGLHVARALLGMGRHQQASATIRDLSTALFYNLEAYAEALSLLRPFFLQGWATFPQGVNEWDAAFLADYAGSALLWTGELGEALAAYSGSLLADLRRASWGNLRISLFNISNVLSARNRLAKHERCRVLALELAVLTDYKKDLFKARLDRFRQLGQIGRWSDAEAMWRLLDPMGRDWSRGAYRPGDAEYDYAVFRSWRGDLEEEHLDRAEQLAKAGKNRTVIRFLHGLRGRWWSDQGQWTRAAESFHEAVRMAREVGQGAEESETRLALAKFHLGQLPDARRVAEQLAKASWVARGALADLWLAIGDRDQAKKYALKAYEWAWADGEPYVRRYELNKARALLEQLGGEIPKLPSYDPAKDEKLPWEDEVVAAIETLSVEKEKETERQKNEKKDEVEKRKQESSKREKRSPTTRGRKK